MARPLKTGIWEVVVGFAMGAIVAARLCLLVIWIVGGFNDQTGDISLSDGEVILVIAALFLPVIIAPCIAIAIALAIIRRRSSRFVLLRPWRAAALGGASYFLVPLAIVPIALGLGWRDPSDEMHTWLLLWLFLVPAGCIFYFGRRATRMTPPDSGERGIAGLVDKPPQSADNNSL